MAKRINRTYKGVVTKRWQKRENDKQKIRIIFLVAFMLVARIALADTSSVVITPEPQEAVSEEPPTWTPEGLNGVTNDFEEKVKANLYRDEVKIAVEVKPEPVRAVVVSPGKEEIIKIITEKAIEYGVNVNLALDIANCESGYDTQAKNKVSTATGTWQFTAGTWKDGVANRGLNWTLEDRKDIYKSTDMAMWYMAKGEISRWACLDIVR